MITIKKICNEDLDELLAYDNIKTKFKKQLNYNNKEYFAIIDDTMILGHASITLFPSNSAMQIHEIYILPQERNKKLGDSLLRAILNYGRINLCTWAIVKDQKNSLENFLIKEGMKKINYNKLPLQIKNLFKKNIFSKYYICIIEDFFNRKCCKCKV